MSATKRSAELCVTHHYACDCREWEHACQVEALRRQLAEAEEQRANLNRIIRQQGAAIEDGQAKIALAERDARRYQWIVGAGRPKADISIRSMWGLETISFYTSNADEHIDAAIAAGEGKDG